MNILILSWRGIGHPHAGGAEVSTHEHAKAWIKAGHKVTLFTSYYSGAKREEEIDGVQIKRYGRQVFGVQIEAFKWYVFKDHPKFDLIIDQFHGIPFFTPLYIRAKKLGFIHEVTKEVWKLNPWPPPFNIIAFAVGTTVEPLIFKYLYFNIPFMTVSESTKKDLTFWGIAENNITIIHNGINIFKIKTTIKKEKKKTLIFLGSLSKDKGIEDAIKVFSLIDKKQNDWQFWIIGKADVKYLKVLKNLANKLNLDNKLKFFGYVGEREKYELLTRAHILINPSIREGWGLVVIEAAAVGTPTIGYKVVGLKDSILDNRTGVLTKKNTPEEMAENVLELMSDQPRYIRMCYYAKKWSNRFSWANSVKQSLSLLKEIYGKV